MDSFTISGFEVVWLEGKRPPTEGFCGWIQANPSKVYDTSPVDTKGHKPEDQGDGLPYSAAYLRVKTLQGPEGLYGPVDREATEIVLHQLKTRVAGMDALAGELVWDRLVRDYRHSRSGHYMMAVSAIDNALWDLRGRYFGVPVYRLLGGPTRREIPVYASCLGYSIDPEAAGERATLLKSRGFTRQKWFLAYGPSQGRPGHLANVGLAEAVRAGIGDDGEMMFDAFMGWNIDYAVAWAKAAERYEPAWIEEAFAPTEVDAFRALRERTHIPVASGEHLYNRWEVLRYLERGAISVVQADPEWCGGVSELVRICSLASAFGARVIPHGHSIHAALHVIASQSPGVCPMAEYLMNKMDHYHFFEQDPPIAVEGRLTLPERPGFGIAIDESKVDRMTVQG